MTQVKTRKQRVMFTVEQKLDYVKLMVNEGYTNRQLLTYLAQAQQLLLDGRSNT